MGRSGEAASNAAHPRVGGENLTWVDIEGRRKGSSPRGRGKLGGEVKEVANHRLIPAWAGKTGKRRRSICPRWAHPRVGGENPF